MNLRQVFERALPVHVVHPIDEDRAKEAVDRAQLIRARARQIELETVLAQRRPQSQ